MSLLIYQNIKKLLKIYDTSQLVLWRCEAMSNQGNCFNRQGTITIEYYNDIKNTNPVFDVCFHGISKYDYVMCDFKDIGFILNQDDVIDFVNSGEKNYSLEV